MQRIRLNQDQIEAVVSGYLNGAEEGSINFVEFTVEPGTQEIANGCHEVVGFTFDSVDFYSEDLIGPTGSVSGSGGVFVDKGARRYSEAS